MRFYPGLLVLPLMMVMFLMLGVSQRASANDLSSSTISAPAAVQAILFRADWCSNCHILEPILEQAMAQVNGVPVELVVLDFTNAERWDQSIETALDHNVVKIYNAYAGITGLVVLTASDTGERIGCFNRTFSAPAMVHAMKQAVITAESAPPGQRDGQSMFCPPGRSPL